MLAHGCALDLPPRAFGPGRRARSAVARTPVVLVARDEPGAVLRALVRASCAGHLADRLRDAATEYAFGHPRRRLSDRQVDQITPPLCTMTTLPSARSTSWAPARFHVWEAQIGRLSPL